MDRRTLCKTMVVPTKGLIRRAFALIVCAALCNATFAQEDSTALYRKIHDFSQKRKVTRWIYDAVFAQPEPEEAPPAPKTPPRRVVPGERYAGRVIRNVNITVTDPFGFSVDDTAKAPVAMVQKAGNRLHRRTRHYVIRNLLLVNEGDTLDPLRIAESERLLRASPVVNDARITVLPIKGDKKFVDLQVIVHDKWNYDAFGTGSLAALRVTGRDRNLLGWGQQVEQQVYWGPSFERPEFTGNHQVYNIENSYISTRAEYALTPLQDRFGVRLDRPFFSALTRNAGGLSWNKTWNRIALLDSVGERLGTQRLDPASFDTWFGRSFPFANDGTEPGRTTNIIASARYNQTRFTFRPSAEEDSLGVYRNVSTLLFGAGFSARQYYRERFLFRYGAMEDVPEGLLLKVVGGTRWYEGERSLLYSGVEASRGRYYADFGYLSVGAGYGTFWENGEHTDATLRASFLYFSNLVTAGRWHFREFIRGNMVMGFDKPDFSRINLNGDQLYGFRSDLLTGTHKELLTFETVAYAPYNILGFRFAPVLLYGLGTIGDEDDPIFSGRIYHALTLGLLIRNENLLVNTFEVSFSFFPFVPEEQGSVFDSGRFTNFSLRAPGFEFTQPDVVGYY